MYCLCFRGRCKIFFILLKSLTLCPSFGMRYTCRKNKYHPFLAPGALVSRWVMLTHQTLCHKLMRPVVNKNQDTWADASIGEKEDLEASIPVFQDHKSATGRQGEEFN